MRTHVLSTLLLLLLALSAGFSLAKQSSASFEVEAIKADMEEAGPQYEAALVQYPQASVRVYALYGRTPELQEVFRKYGHNQIVPIIEKCLDEGDALLRLGSQFDEIMSSPLNKKIEISEVTPVECGWRAILLTSVAGNDFLGRYAIDERGEAHLLPGSSLFAVMKRFTTSGLQVLEKKFVLGENPTLKEWGWGLLDVVGIGLTGKAVATAVKRGIARVARPTVGHKLTTAQSGIIGFARAYTPRIRKYATVVGIGYLALYHPQVITGAAEIIAETLGVSPLMVQTLVWGVILFIPAWILITLLLLLRSLFGSFPFRIVRASPRAAM
jgi:hypothetical protein